MKYQLDFEKPILELQRKLEELKKHPESHSLSISFEDEVALMEQKIQDTKRQIFAQLSAWDRVKIARHPKRPFTLDYVAAIFTDFAELHGDRLFADDRAVVGGFAKLGEQKLMVIGTQKGRDTKENIKRNFGSAHPEGYRKAIRLMKLADKYSLPIVTLIDTAGAYPGIGAEERHIAEAIAVNLREMMLLEVPLSLAKAARAAHWASAWPTAFSFWRTHIIRSSVPRDARRFCGKTGPLLRRPPRLFASPPRI
jgi:acetyl-CoA carboxylase carboxyl transferase subunit alpha